MKRTLRGFSYFEVILYLGLFSMLATALFQYSWDAIDLSIKNRTERRILSDARILSERLNAIIRNASSIDMVDSVFETEQSKLVLTDDSGDTIQVAIVNGQLLLSRDGTQIALHSSQSRLISFWLSATGQAINHSEAVSYSLTMDTIDSDAVTDALYIAPITIRSGGFIRMSGL